MKKKVYVLIISLITIACIIIGSTHHIGGFMDGGFNFFGGKTKNIAEDVEIGEFSSMDIESNIMDIEIHKGDSFKCHYECNKEKLVSKVSIDNGVLKVTQKNSGGWSFFGSNNKCKITITVPDGKSLAGVKIKTDVGDLNMSDIVTEKFDLESDTGDAIIKNSNLGGTKIDTDTGDITVSGSVMADVKLICDTGDVKTTDTTMAGIDIDSDTGDISIKGGIKVATYNVSISTDTGDIFINGDDQGDKCSMNATEGDGLTMKISTDTGDVTISE